MLFILLLLCLCIDFGSCFAFDLDEIAAVRVKRDDWVQNLHSAVEKFYDRLPLTPGGKRGYVTFSKLGHTAFSGALGPIGPKCKNLESYGKGDDEKRACGLADHHGDCAVISVGSNNQYGFEREILRRTNCSVHSFDCTIKFHVPADLLKMGDRLKTYELCVSDRPLVNKRGWKFDTWTKAMEVAGVSQPTHVKMDIEGFEYSVLESIATSQYAPLQISLELHYATQMAELSWLKRFKTPAEMAIFMAELYRKAGYFVVDRHDNKLCGHCSEIVLARFPSIKTEKEPTIYNNNNNNNKNCEVLPFIPTKEDWIPTGRSCCAWFKTINLEGGNVTKIIPPALRPAFTMWGAAVERTLFFDQRYSGADSLSFWSKSVVDGYIEYVKNSTPKETYPGAAKLIRSSLNAHPVTGLSGAVFGSESPWVEAILLANGAAHVATIEYEKIYSTHPQITALTPFELKEAATRGDYVGQFDFVMTYSSLKHSGLGRYGDPLSPFADLEWIQRIKCLLKPNGLLYFGVPMSSQDCLVFNAHRVYGPVRLAAVKRGFQELGLYGAMASNCGVSQPILVLQKVSAPSSALLP